MTASPLGCAVLTISDSRTEENDTSGSLLVELLQADDHHLVEKRIVVDDRYQMRAQVSAWIAASEVDVILTTGGTGFTGRDTTPEALLPLFDKVIDGFGELFRVLSYAEIGTSTVQSRAFGGLANGTLIFCMPGSGNACRTAWKGVLSSQLNRNHRPCNFVELIPRFKET